MKVRVVLENPGGELANELIDIRDGADDDVVNDAIHNAIEGWFLSAGDTIKITEES